MASTQEDSSDAKPKKPSALSLGLGYCICAGSVFAKAPQIIQILRAGSAAGLSVWMPLMEVLGYTLSFGYHAAKSNPLSAYGEDYFNCFSAAVVAYQVLRYQGRMAGLGIQLVGLGSYGVLVGAMVQCRQLLPSRKAADRLLDVLLSLSTAIFIAARWPQIIVGFRNRGVGQLNVYTTSLYLFGNLVRIYTTLTQLQGDNISLVKSGSSAVGNLLLVLQWRVLGPGLLTVA